MMLFPELPSTSKVWLYAADRELTSDEQIKIQQALDHFVSDWAAHGSQLYGNSSILFNRFIILAVDQSKVYASGCSIDASTNFIKQLGTHFQIDFFNRLFVYLQNDDEIQRVHFSEISNYPNAGYFDLSVNHLESIRTSWPVIINVD